MAGAVGLVCQVCGSDAQTRLIATSKRGGQLIHCDGCRRDSYVLGIDQTRDERGVVAITSEGVISRTVIYLAPRVKAQ